MQKMSQANLSHTNTKTDTDALMTKCYGRNIADLHKNKFFTIDFFPLKSQLCAQRCTYKHNAALTSLAEYRQTITLEIETCDNDTLTDRECSSLNVTQLSMSSVETQTH